MIGTYSIVNGIVYSSFLFSLSINNKFSFCVMDYCESCVSPFFHFSKLMSVNNHSTSFHDLNSRVRLFTIFQREWFSQGGKSSFAFLHNTATAKDVFKTGRRAGHKSLSLRVLYWLAPSDGTSGKERRRWCSVTLFTLNWNCQVSTR